jgi:hypothetical protein
MTIQRSTFILAGSLFLTASAFAGSQDSKRERLEIVQEYSGSSMLPADQSVSFDTVILPKSERGNLNK